MKQLICFVLSVVLLVSLTACDGKADITGIWEQEMEMTILGEGIEEPTSAASLCRFTFREDGTGIQENIITDESHADAVREFAWKLEGDTLTLDFEGDHTEEFTIVLTKTSLKLENPRGSYDLTKMEP